MNMRELFQMKAVNMSVAVWVGFIALFGIATDDGVLMGTYLDQSFKKHKTTTLPEIKEAVVIAGQRRIKPAIMTSATTIIDRKSTRLNSSHVRISYAVFCLKKKKQKTQSQVDIIHI